MATYQSDIVSGASNTSFKPFPSGMLGVRSASFTNSTALENGDVIEMIPVFKGETVHAVHVVINEFDSNGSPTGKMDFGDGDDPNRFIENGGVNMGADNTTQVGTYLADDQDTGAGFLTSAGYQYTADDTIDAKVVAAVATGATSKTLTVTAIIS